MELTKMSGSLITEQTSEATTAKKISSPKSLIIVAVILLIVTALLQFPQYWLLNIDASVFWYEGQQILKGKIPYRDMWDHKPPLIYYFNALCLLILPAKVEVLRIVSVLLSFGTSFFLFLSLKRLFSTTSLILVVVLLFSFYLNNNFVDNGFFYTENLQVFFIGIAFYFFVKWYQKFKNWDLALTGLFYSLALLTKQTELGLVLITAFLIFYRSWKANKFFSLATLRQFSWFVVPLLLPAFVFAVYFLLNNAWGDFFDQNFIYNRYYISNVSFSSIFFDNLGSLFDDINSFSWLFALAFFATLVKLTRKNSRQNLWQTQRLLVLSLIWSFIDFITIDLSGRGYNHYYLQLLVPFAVVIMYFLQDITSFLTSRLYPKQPVKKKLILTLTAILCVLVFVGMNLLEIGYDVYHFDLDATNFNQPLNLSSVLGTNALFDVEGSEISDYLHSEDKKLDSQSIYVWGHGAQVLFYVGASSASKYIYNLPFFTPGYATPALYTNFMQQLQKNPPVYFIDTGFPDYIFPTTIDPSTVDDVIAKDALNYPVDPTLRKQLQDFLQQNYTVDKVFNSGMYAQMTLYRLKAAVRVAS